MKRGQVKGIRKSMDINIIFQITIHHVKIKHIIFTDDSKAQLISGKIRKIPCLSAQDTLSFLPENLFKLSNKN